MQSTPKILIAEDDLTSCRLLSNLLERWGYKVVVCDNGDDAYRLLKGEKDFSVAILDWIMPGLDGAQVCHKISSAKNINTHLIILSIKDEINSITTGLELGADDYLSKPFVPEELRARVKVGVRSFELKEEMLNGCRLLMRLRERMSEYIDSISLNAQELKTIKFSGEKDDSNFEEKLSALLKSTKQIKKYMSHITRKQTPNHP